MDPNLFHWTESNIESIQADGFVITIIANNVLIDDSDVPTRIKLSFSDVSHSVRKVTEYLHGSKEINSQKHPYLVKDMDTVFDSALGKKYYIEGVTEFEPNAWIEWDIIANEHSVEKIDKTTIQA